MSFAQKKCFADVKRRFYAVSKKKILFASKDLKVGGMEKALVNLLSGIDKDIYDITLVLEKAEGPLISQIDRHIRIIEYKVSDFVFPPVRKAVNFLRRIAFKAKHEKKYDFSCCYATYSTPCEKISKIASDNCALYVHSDYVGMYSGDIEKARQFYDSIGISEYKKVLFVSDGARDGALEIYPQLEDAFITLGNIVDTESIIKLSEQKADIPEREGKKVLVFVGRLDDTSKKLKRLLEAVSIVSEKRDDFELWVIGKGPDGEMYRKYADELGIMSFVRFMGEITNPYPYVKNADCLVLSSDYEGFPVVYSEAAVLGVSIITTVPASDGFFEINPANAYISEKNSESMAKKISEFLEGTVKKVPSADFTCSNAEKLKIFYRNVDK